MNTDDDIGTTFDTKSLCSDISLNLDDSFFRRDSFSLSGRGNASNPFHLIVDYQICNQGPPISYSPQQYVPYVQDEEKEREDIATSKESRKSSKVLLSPRRQRTIDRKTSSFDPTKVSREHRHVIQHNYCDHAFDPEETDTFNGRVGTKKNPASLSLVAKKKGGVSIPFPLKLHELLEKAEEENLTHIVSWQSHGRAFVVHDPKMFVRYLMPRFFRQTKLTSFQRQLNLYGFCRLTRGRDSGGYYHELFLRGKTNLTKRMARTKIKGTGYKAATNPSCEPDFYKMPPVGPNTSHQYQSINANADIVCDSESDHYGNDVDDDGSVDHHTFPQLPNIPIVTPTNSFHTLAETSVRSELASFLTNDGTVTYGSNPLDGEVWPCFECTPPMFTSTSSSRNDVSHLKPRRRSPIVRMGNQSFQYIESLHLNTSEVPNFGVRRRDEDSVCFSESNSTPDSEMLSALSYCDSSTIGDISLSVIDENSIQYDPLDIFLREMGDSYREDMNEFPQAVKRKN